MLTHISDSDKSKNSDDVQS